MKNLEYRGTKSTRFKWLVAISLGSTLLFVTGNLSEAAWVELMKWAYIAYTGSEGVNKVAEAYRDKAAGTA